jgi:GNAT superfamily N-acetyltransferase
MEIRRLDLADESTLRRWHEISEVADTYQRPWCTQWSYEELAIQVHSDEANEWVLTGAFEGDRMVGAACLALPRLDNVDKVYAGFYVEPPLRRRGIGGALVEHAAAWARAGGRAEILTDTGVPDAERDTHPYVRFAHAHGFTTADVEVHRVLTVPLPLADIKQMQAECAPHHDSYELRTFHDEMPDGLLESYCYLENRLAVDAPSGDIDFEAEAMTPELFLQQLERLRRQGRHKLVTVAVDAAGEAVATTDLVVPRTDRPKVYQWATLVRRDHRGHHLGAAVKLQNLLSLQELYPDRTEIHTTNSEVNDTMIGINERLGFRVVEVLPELVLRL